MAEPTPLRASEHHAIIERKLNQLQTADLINRTRGPHDGGEPPIGDDMEKRVTELERNMTQAAMDLSYIKGRMEDMPTKDFITTRLVFVVGGFTGMLALIGYFLKVS